MIPSRLENEPPLHKSIIDSKADAALKIVRTFYEKCQLEYKASLKSTFFKIVVKYIRSKFFLKLAAIFCEFLGVPTFLSLSVNLA